MGIFNSKTKDGKKKVPLMLHYSGLPGFTSNDVCDIILDTDINAVVFKPKMNKKAPEVTLPISKIISAGRITLTDTQEQSKMGRAVVGGLLFGPAGAIVGALTADEKKKYKSFYIFNYKSDGEEKAITIIDNGNINLPQFNKALQELLPKKQEETFSDNITL